MGWMNLWGKWNNNREWARRREGKWFMVLGSLETGSQWGYLQSEPIPHCSLKTPAASSLRVDSIWNKHCSMSPIAAEQNTGPPTAESTEHPPSHLWCLDPNCPSSVFFNNLETASNVIATVCAVSLDLCIIHVWNSDCQICPFYK